MAQDSPAHAAFFSAVQAGRVKDVLSFLETAGELDLAKAQLRGRTAAAVAQLYGHSALANALQFLTAEQARLLAPSTSTPSLPSLPHASRKGLRASTSTPALPRAGWHRALRRAGVIAGASGDADTRGGGSDGGAAIGEGRQSTERHGMRASSSGVLATGHAATSIRSPGTVTARDASVSPLRPAGARALRGDALTPMSQRGRAGAVRATAADLEPVLLTSKQVPVGGSARRAAERAWTVNNLEWELDTFTASRGMKPAYRFSRDTRAKLRSWFAFMDDDGSGEIEVTELEDPMLSTGLVANHRELTELFNWIDKDGSGDIDVWEFMSALLPTAKWRGESDTRTGSDAQRRKQQPGGKGRTLTPSKPSSTSEPSAPASPGAAQGELAPVLSVEQLRQQFLPKGKEGGQAMTALLDLIAGGDPHLSIPTKLTAQRRAFLMNMLVGGQAEESRARRELHRALTAAQAAGDHVTILRLRDLQREREAHSLRNIERVKALRIIIQRKQAERAAGGQSEAAEQGSAHSDAPGTAESPKVHRKVHGMQDTRVGALQALEAAAAALREQETQEHSSSACASQLRHHTTGAVGSAAAADAAWELQQSLMGGGSPSRRRGGGPAPDSFAALAEGGHGGDHGSTRAITREQRLAVRVPVEGWVEGGKMADMARLLAGRMV